MADCFLDRLDGTIVLQGLGDKGGPGGMGRDAGVSAQLTPSFQAYQAVA